MEFCATMPDFDVNNAFKEPNADEYKNKGNLAFREQNWDEAIENYNKAISQNPTQARL